MQHYTEILSDFVFSLKYSDLPCETVENTKKFILDWYSACFAGMRVNAVFNSAVRAVMLSGAQGGSAILCDGARRYSESDAAFMNAVYAHGADMDDGNRLAMGHIGAHVISAVLAVAENEGRKRKTFFSGEEVLIAIIAGYEVFNRVAASAQPGLVKRGFHSTGVAGGIACAAAVAKLLGLDREGIYNSLSLGALQSSGLIIIAESGQSAKPLNAANAARNGILSARMAQRNGIFAPRYPLESEKGWFHAMTDCVNAEQITDGLGTRYTVDESYLKPYPSCRHTHAPIQIALMLREEIRAAYGRLPLELIDDIRVFTYENAIRIAGVNSVPRCSEDTKFSIQYALAYALINGCFGLHALNMDALTEEAIGVISKVRLISEPAMERANEGIRGARIEIVFSDGRMFSDTVLIPKGESTAPFSEADAMEKLRACSEGILTEEQISALKAWVESFEKQEFISLNLPLGLQ